MRIGYSEPYRAHMGLPKNRGRFKGASNGLLKGLG